MPDQNLVRLHRFLVDAVQRAGNDPEAPITVAQIYQELVPYREARSSIGFEMNADYEYAVLRLLAGEGDLVRLEPPEVRELLQRELDSPNPNVSLFRAYANCDVFVEPAAEWTSGDSGGSGVEIEFSEAPVSQKAQESSSSAPFEAPPPRAEAPSPEPASAARSITATPTTVCGFCGGPLPDSRLVNFCPHCGNDLTRLPCSNCGETLEANWRFCVSCGAPAASYDASAN
jgi:predicted RNA-binding Zn-ribbon protein involved in translation (DUF1610 family)